MNDAGTELKKKWENYWYYYKWHTIAAIFVVIVAVIFIRDIVTKEKYDASVLMVCSEYIEEASVESLRAEMAAYFPDTDGNGEVNIEVTPIAVIGGYDIPADSPREGVDVQLDSAMRTKLMAELGMSHNQIFVFDDGFKDMFVTQSGLKDVSADVKSDKLTDGGKVFALDGTLLYTDSSLDDYAKYTGRTMYMAFAYDAQISGDKKILTFKNAYEGFTNIANGVKLCEVCSPATIPQN